MEEVKLSVIVPVYNAESTLCRCLDSILVQNISGMELIIIDDGSKDDSRAIEEDYARSYPDIIRLQQKENGGEASARNAGLRLAKGEYITFVDNDDFLKQGYYQEVYQKISAYNLKPDIIVTGCSHIKNEVESKSNVQLSGVVSRNQLANEFFRRSRDADLRVVWNKFFKSSSISGISFENRVGATDQIFCLEAFAVAESILFVDICGYVQVMNQNSITHNLVKKYDRIYELEYSLEYREHTKHLYKQIGISDAAIYEEHCRTDYVWFYILAKNVMNTNSPYKTKKAQIDRIREIMSSPEPRECILNCSYKSKLSLLVKVVYQINSPSLARWLLKKV